MRWLRRRGLRGVSVGELMSASRHGAGRELIGLTFDDGYADFIEYALPVLARYGFGGTVFAIAGRLGGLNDWDARGPRKPLMSADQVRKAADAEIEIGSHGLRHVSLPGLAEAALAAEAAESRAILTETTGRRLPGSATHTGTLTRRPSPRSSRQATPMAAPSGARPVPARTRCPGSTSERPIGRCDCGPRAPGTGWPGTTAARVRPA